MSISAHTQQKNVQLSLSSSTHGTGDMNGISFSLQYAKKSPKNWVKFYGLGSTIHHRTIPLFYSIPGNNNVDGSIRSTTAGFQAAYGAGYSFFNRKISLVTSLAPLLRYQSSSYHDNVAIYYPLPTSSLPFPVAVYNHSSPQNTFAFGGMANVSLNYAVSKTWFVGASASFQTDTNGDAITQLGINVGLRVK